VKKLVPYIIASIIIIPLIAGFFIIKGKSANYTSRALQAVPPDACLIIDNNDLTALINSVLSENEMLKEMQFIEKKPGVFSGIEFIDSLVKNNQDIHDILLNQPLTISHHMTGKDKFEALYILTLPKKTDDKEISSLVSELLPVQTNIRIREYYKTKIYDISFRENQKNVNFSYCFINEYMIFSPSSILLESSLRQFESSSSVLDSPGFQIIESTSGSNSQANIYLNFNTLPKFLSIFTNDQHKNNIRAFNNFANWAELDLNIKKDVIILNGFTYSEDSVKNYINIFRQQKPQKPSIISIMPSSTSSFYTLGISDQEKFLTDYRYYLGLTGHIQSYNSFFENISNKYSFDIEESFYSFLDDEIGMVNISDESDNNIFDNYTVLKTKNWSIAWEELQNFIKSYTDYHNLNMSDFVNEYEVNKDNRHNIYKMPIEGIPGKLFGSLFSANKARYYTLIDKFLIFGNNLNSIKSFIKNSYTDPGLISDKEYIDFSHYMSLKSNFNFYSNISASKNLISQYLNNSLKNYLQKETRFFNKYRAISFQFSASKNMFYNNICIKSEADIISNSENQWESQLEGELVLKPVIINNHITRQKDIVVQDNHENLYLFDKNGTILWKKSIAERILSEIYQIDFYKNGKLQILFNTKNKIHLIDINGNYVDNYPITLSSPATNGMALFDYNNNKDYRFFIACENSSVSAFDKHGKIIKGWKFDKSESEVNHPVQHLRVKNKDYIVFSDLTKLYILNRRGEIRLEIKEEFPVSLNNTILFQPAIRDIPAKMITTDNDGTIKSIDFEGNVESMEIRKFSNSHFFRCIDLNNDGFIEFIYLDNNELEVFDENKQKVFEYSFKKNIKYRPGIFTFPGKMNKIGIVSQSENKIYLFNHDGTIYNGFPLSGNTLFSITNFDISQNHYSLIVGGEKDLLYNYTIK